MQVMEVPGYSTSILDPKTTIIICKPVQRQLNTCNRLNERTIYLPASLNCARADPSFVHNSSSATFFTALHLSETLLPRYADEGRNGGFQAMALGLGLGLGRRP